MEMQSKIRGAKLAWGEPILRINDAVITPPTEFTPLLVADNDIKTGGNVLFYKDKGECNASFEMQIDMPIARSMRRLYIHKACSPYLYDEILEFWGMDLND